jgi:hypothetical protein
MAVDEQAQIRARAKHAVISLAARFGLAPIEPVILHHSQHISIRLLPLDVVARVVRGDEAEAGNKLRRELAVVRHLIRRAAPVVGPITDLPAGPYFQDGFALSLWQFVEHVAADPDNPAHMASAALALRRVHDALWDFPGGELPGFMAKVEECRALLDDDAALVPLTPADRSFLLMVYGRLVRTLKSSPMNLTPIHGDAGTHNVFITADGARYSDFEDASLGPREWDLAGFPDIELELFQPIDHELLSVLRDLRSLCVSVWCWAKYDLSEKREAAEYHLRYLKERFASAAGER